MMNLVTKLINVISTNPIDSVVIAIIVIAVIVYTISKRENLLNRAALYAVTLAETAWGSNTGKIKFAEAYLYLRTNYPIITFFVTEKQLTNIIEKAVAHLKQILASKEAKKDPNYKEQEETETTIDINDEKTITEE